MVPTHASRRIVTAPIVMGLFLLASIYLPFLAYGFAVLHSTLLVVGSIAFLVVLTLFNGRQEQIEEFVGKYNEKAMSLLDENDGSEENQNAIRKKLKGLSNALSVIVDKRQRIFSSLFACFMMFVWAMVYKYVGYETISYIVLVGAVAFPALSSMAYEKISKSCYNEIVDVRDDIDNKIKTHLNNSSE